MKRNLACLLILIPFFVHSQYESGRFSIGTQLYQNLNLPENYEGFGVGVNWEFNIVRGIGLNSNYFFETNDLAGVGSLKRFQRGLGLKYVFLQKRDLSPCVQLGLVYNTIKVAPVSYLFFDKSTEAVEQNYFGVSIGVGGQYKVNDALVLNCNVYFQPQNYDPNYELRIENSEIILNTNISGSTIPEVEPLVYLNIGFTYKVARLW